MISKQSPEFVFFCFLAAPPDAVISEEISDIEMKNGNIYECCSPFFRVFFTAGASRCKYICPRALASHPRQTSGNKVIADKNTNQAANKCAITLVQENAPK
jgi:hypothetical protein